MHQYSCFIEFDIACSACLACAPHGFNFIAESDTKLTNTSDLDLLEFIQDELFECWRCRQVTPGIVTRIELADERKIQKQVKLYLRKDGGRIIVSPVPGSIKLQKDEIQAAIVEIHDYLVGFPIEWQQRERYNALDDAIGLVVVDFNKDGTKVVSILESFGFSWSDFYAASSGFNIFTDKVYATTIPVRLISSVKGSPSSK